MLIDCPQCATAFRISPEVLGAAGRQVRCANCRSVWHAKPEQMRAEAVAEPASAKSDDADWGAAFAEEKATKPAPLPPREEMEPMRVEPAVEVPRLAEAPSVSPDLPPAPLPRTAQSKSRDTDLSPTERARKARRARMVMAMPRSKFGSFRFSWPVAIVIVGTALFVAFFTGRDQVVRTVPDAASVYETLGMPVNLRGVDFRDIKGANETADGVTVLVVEGRLVNITAQPVMLPRLRLAVRDGQGRDIYTWTATPPVPQLGPGEAANFRSRLASPPPDGKTIEVRFLTRQDVVGETPTR